MAALRRHRARAMVLGMLLAGLRRCEVLGLRFADVQVADRRLAVMEGKGGHHRIVPAADRFFDELGAYLHHERPGGAPTDRVFVVLKGPRRGLPLSAEGLDEILDGARRRAGLEHATCHAQLLPLGWLAAAMAFSPSSSMCWSSCQGAQCGDDAHRADGIAESGASAGSSA